MDKQSPSCKPHQHVFIQMSSAIPLESRRVESSQTILESTATAKEAKQADRVRPTDCLRYPLILILIQSQAEFQMEPAW